MLNKLLKNLMESKINRFVKEFRIAYRKFRMLGSSRVGISWARTRTYGSRDRGGRNASYSSLRSGGVNRRRQR
jgi:hypothetical protein